MTGDLLARLAAVPADRQAVVAGDRTLTFGELRAEAMCVARSLTERGVGVESVVALTLGRGADLVVALVGTLTAGAAYLPVDPKLPQDRQRYLIEDAGAQLVIGDGGIPFAELTGDVPAEGGYEPVAVEPGNLAYVIYTSGSTGRPKGVEISRNSAAALLSELESEGIAVTDGGRVSWNASPSFDASVQQWVRLCRGDTIVMIDDQTRSDPELLAKLIDDTALTDLDITPSHLDPLLEHLTKRDGREPMTVLVGGEAISPSLWQRIAELVESGDLRAVNVYGPTECTVDSTAGWITPGVKPHIGTVLPGLSMRLLDEKLRPVADGEEGELYLAGPRVGRGYRNRPGLTAQRFPADIEASDGTRMYRTGDLCRQVDGRLEYIGRRDGQIKLRGFRVEVGEIEAAVAAFPDVIEAAVVLRDGQLVAYYRAATAVDEEQLHKSIADSLPVYMVPAGFMWLERFPTTTNGKLDRAALPAPTAPAAPAVAVQGEQLNGRVEKLIAEVWSHVLGTPQISADDNFFKLGGHSLLAIKLVAGVRSELGIRLPVKKVYENPRLGDLAREIESMMAAV